MEKVERTIRYNVNRRRFLRDSTLATLGLIAAACAPGTGTTGTTGGGAASQKGGEFHGAWPYDLPPKGHYNYFATGAVLSGGVYTDLFIPALGMWNWAEGKWIYFLAESSRLNGNVFEVKLRPNLKWSDGAAFTSKDVVTTYTIGRMEGFGIWSYIDKVEAAGDLTVNFTYKTPSSLGERLILRNGIRPDSQFGAIAAKAATQFAAGKTVTSDEIKALRTELAALRPTTPPSVGPYKIDPGSVNEAQLTFIRNENGLFGKDVNFDKVVIYQGETAAVTPLVLAGDIDYATHGFPVATEKGFQDAGIRILRSPAYTGPALVFHWDKAAAFQDKRLRQAVAYAVNREELAKITYAVPSHQKFMAGIPDEIVPQWISSADQSKLNAYAFDQKKATDLMTAAGYAKGGDGIWAKGGQKLEFELYFPSDFADWSAAADYLQKSLNTFGIKITPRGAIRSQQLPDVNEGKFQLTLMGWAIGNPHPQGSYVQNLRTHNTTPAGGGMKYPLKQTSDAVGAVDFDQLIDQMGQGFDTNAQKATVTKMAQAFNELLPIIPLAERFGNNPLNEKARVAGWKPDGDPVYKNAFGTDNFAVLMIMNGTLRKK
jgi:peptide/nickel transport system substrate-binding protein